MKTGRLCRRAAPFLPFRAAVHPQDSKSPLSIQRLKKAHCASTSSNPQGCAPGLIQGVALASTSKQNRSPHSAFGVRRSMFDVSPPLFASDNRKPVCAPIPARAFRGVGRISSVSAFFVLHLLSYSYSPSAPSKRFSATHAASSPRSLHLATRMERFRHRGHHQSRPRLFEPRRPQSRNHLEQQAARSHPRARKLCRARRHPSPHRHRLAHRRFFRTVFRRQPDNRLPISTRHDSPHRSTFEWNHPQRIPNRLRLRRLET